MAGATARRVEVLHFNDVYHCDDFANKTDRALRMLLSMQRPEVVERQPLITFGGDLLAPSLMSSVTKGNHMMEVLELFGVHVATAGNHDFDFGVDRLRELTREESLFEFEGQTQRARSVWLSSNITGMDGLPIAGTQACWLQKWQDVSVGILAVSENWLSDAGLSPNSSAADKHAKWEDEVQAARHWAKTLREQGAELVLCLCHDNMPQMRRLVKEVEEVDFFLGGHEHVYASGDRFVIAGYDFDDYCLLSFDVPADGSRPRPPKQERVQVPGNEPLPEPSALEGDAARLWKLVDHYRKLVDKQLSESLECRLTAPLDTRKFLMRTQETPAGNLFADAVLKGLNDRGAEAECCLLIAGMISAGKGVRPAGELTLGDVVEWFPWEGGTCVVEVPGSVLLDALEHGCHMLPYRYGMFPQVSGIEFCITVNPDDASFTTPGAPLPHRRVSHVRVNGEDLEENRLYRVATGEYLADGNDGYDMLAKLNRVVSPEAGPLLWDAVVSHLKALGPEVEPPAVSGRIRHMKTFQMNCPAEEVGATAMDPVSIEETVVRALEIQ